MPLDAVWHVVAARSQTDNEAGTCRNDEVHDRRADDDTHEGEEDCEHWRNRFVQPGSKLPPVLAQAGASSGCDTGGRPPDKAARPGGVAAVLGQHPHILQRGGDLAGGHEHHDGEGAPPQGAGPEHVAERLQVVQHEQDVQAVVQAVQRVQEKVRLLSRA